MSEPLAREKGLGRIQPSTSTFIPGSGLSGLLAVNALPNLEVKINLAVFDADTKSLQVGISSPVWT